MANWTTLKKAIASVIKTNGNQEITGAVLQSTLNSIVNAVGENATFAGVATPSTNPGTPDGPVFYLASEIGTYSNFNQLIIELGEIGIFIYNNSWKKQSLKYEISEVNVSKIYPTGGIDGTNKYTLETAIAMIPMSLRSVGIKCLFLKEDNALETWEYQGGAFLDVYSWKQSGAAGIKELQRFGNIATFLEKRFHLIRKYSLRDFTGNNYTFIDYNSNEVTFKKSENINGSRIISMLSKEDVGLLADGHYIIVGSIADILNKEETGVQTFYFNLVGSSTLGTLGLKSGIYYGEVNYPNPTMINVTARFDGSTEAKVKFGSFAIYEYSDELLTFLKDHVKAGEDDLSDMQSALISSYAKEAEYAEKAENASLSDDLSVLYSPFRFAFSDNNRNFSIVAGLYDPETRFYQCINKNNVGTLFRINMGDKPLVGGQAYIYVMSLYNIQSEDSVKGLAIQYYTQIIGEFKTLRNGIFYSKFVANNYESPFIQIQISPYNTLNAGESPLISFNIGFIGIIEYSTEAEAILSRISQREINGKVFPIYSLNDFNLMDDYLSSFIQLSDDCNFIKSKYIKGVVAYIGNLSNTPDFNKAFDDTSVVYSGTTNANSASPYVGFGLQKEFINLEGHRNFYLVVKGQIKGTNLQSLDLCGFFGITIEHTIISDIQDNREAQFESVIKVEYKENSSVSSYVFLQYIARDRNAPCSAEVRLTKYSIFFNTNFDNDSLYLDIANSPNTWIIPKYVGDDYLTKKQAEEFMTSVSSFAISPYAGKRMVYMGDSHSVGNRGKYWSTRVAESLRMELMESIEDVISPYIYPLEGYEQYVDAMYAQAVRAVEQYKAGNEFDVIVMENVHYHSDDKPEDVTPISIKNTYSYGKVETTNIDAWWKTNFSAVVSSVSKKYGTVVNIQYSNISYILNFRGTPQAGIFTLIIDTQKFVVEVQQGNSLSEVIDLLNTWVFEDYCDWKNSASNNSTLTITYNGEEEQIPLPSISYDAGTTGITMSYEKSTDYPYAYYYFDSLENIDNRWLDITYWTKVENWGGDKNGTRILKGVFEYLLQNLPKVTLLCFAPIQWCIRDIDRETYTTPAGFNATAFMKSGYYQSGQKNLLLEVAKYYHLKTVSLEESGGINPVNYSQYYNDNDVHPTKEGYIKWAELLTRELL